MFDDYHRDAALRYLQRGLLLERVNRVDEAVKQYRRALSFNPNLREAQSVLGTYYERQGLLAKAAEAFSVLANLEPTPQSYLHLGRIFSASGQYDSAMDALQRALSLAPDSFDIVFALATLLFRHEQYQQACEYLLQALALQPCCWETRYLLMISLVRLGKHQDAADLLQSAPSTRLDSSGPEPMHRCVSMLERLKQCGESWCEQTRLYVEQGIFSLTDRVLPQRYFTYPDVALLLRSFLSLYERYAWPFNCLVALERTATPIADILSEQMALPVRRFEQLSEHDCPLLIIGVGREPELLDVVVEQIPCKAVVFCFALNWLSQRVLYPDICGASVQGVCKLPWENELRRLRLPHSSPKQAEACMTHITALLRNALMQTPSSDCALPFTPAHFAKYRFSHVFPQA
jgi:Tfp pilus assembly protein PilF